MKQFLWVAAIFVWQVSTYFIAKPFQKPERQHVWKYRLDDRIPMQPGFIWAYLLCYFWWWGVMAAHLGDLRFAAAAILGYLLAALTFILYPTRILGREQVRAAGLTGLALRITFAADTPQNLFPSVHVFVSALCLITALETGGLWLLLSLVFFLAVCWSTLVLRQHYLPDLWGGVLLALITWNLAALPPLQEAARFWIGLFLNLI